MTIPDKTPTAKTCPNCGPSWRLVVVKNTETGQPVLAYERPGCQYTEPLTEDLKMQLLGADRLPGF